MSGPLAPTQQRLHEASARADRVHRTTAQAWSDSARREYDQRIADRLTAAVRQYASTLAELDLAAERAMAMLRE